MSISMYFGSPGCGKTTTAVRLLLKERPNYEQTFANFSCEACDVDNVELDGLGETWTFQPHSLICIDESGIEYNSRHYKSFPHSLIRWYKKHRHFECDVAFFSQSWNDTDKIIRDLCTNLYYVVKFGAFTMVRRVHKRVTVDKNTEQIIDGFRMSSLLYLLFYPLKPILRLFIPSFADVDVFYRPLYYSYFDTLEKEELPYKYIVTEKKHIPSPASNCFQAILTRFGLDQLKGKTKRG